MDSQGRERLAGLTGSQQTNVPQPKRSLWRRALPGALLLALIGLALYASRERFVRRIPVQTAMVVTKTIGAGEVVGQARASVQAPGWVEPAPYPIYASALTSGVLESLLVLEGDHVEKGDPLAKLVADDAALARRRAAAELTLRQAELTAAEANWQHPTGLKRAVAVAKAELAENVAALAEADAMIARAEAKTAEADAANNRYAGAPAGTFPALDVDRARYALAIMRAEENLAREGRKRLAAAGLRLQAELAAAEEALKLRIADADRLATAKAAVAAAEAALAEADLRVERLTVRAPAAGVVMERLKAPGSKVMLDMDDAHSAHVAHLYDPKRLQVRVDIPLADAGKVTLGQAATIVVDILPDVSFDGRLTRFVHAADISKNTVQVKVEIDAPSALLKPDMLARVKFLASETKAAGGGGDTVSLVPDAAIVDATENAAVVWVLAPGGDRVMRREVSLGGVWRDSWRLVESGLNPGDVVVVSPPTELSDGARVTPTEARQQ